MRISASGRKTWNVRSPSGNLGFVDGFAMTVRDASSDDGSDLVAVFPHADRLRWRITLANRGTEDLLVVEIGGVVRGLMSIRWSDGCDPPNPWLYGAEVAESFRSNGLGTALWNEAERRCIQGGATAASLDVDVDNVHAQRLYLRLGYEIVGPHQHRWRSFDPDTRALVAEGTSETWIMRKRLM